MEKPLKKKIFSFLKIFFLCFAVAVFIWPVYFVILYKFVPVYYTPLMLQRFFEDGNFKMPEKTWVSFEKISPDMSRAVISSEDNLFLKHGGFSMANIKKAIEDHRKGKKLRGGSTISQQCAKNVFWFPIRSYFRKAHEAYLTVLIEFIWGKKRIMEVYLNVIETGDGVYGVEKAAEKFFLVKAEKLSKAQCALIAACLPNPRIYHVDRPSNYTKKRQAKILELMPKMGNLEF